MTGEEIYAEIKLKYLIHTMTGGRHISAINISWQKWRAMRDYIMTRQTIPRDPATIKEIALFGVTVRRRQIRGIEVR